MLYHLSAQQQQGFTKVIRPKIWPESMETYLCVCACVRARACVRACGGHKETGVCIFFMILYLILILYGLVHWEFRLRIGKYLCCLVK